MSGAPDTLQFYSIVCNGCCSTASYETKERAIAKWNSRIPAPSVAPVKEEIVRRIAIARTEKANAEKSGYDRDALRLDGAIGVLENLLEDIEIAAPASTVAPQTKSCGFCGKSDQEVKALIQAPVGYICENCVAICASIIEKNVPPVAPVEQIDDGWVTFGRVKVDIENETETFERTYPPAPASPAALRDEASVEAERQAAAIVTIWRAIKDRDDRLLVRYIKQALLEWQPATATTPTSTLAKAAADLLPKSTYKDKRPLADEERFKFNAALNDYLFNNCDHEHDGYPNHLACRWCVLEFIAAIIERCLSGGGEDQKSTPTGLSGSPRYPG